MTRSEHRSAEHAPEAAAGRPDDVEHLEDAPRHHDGADPQNRMIWVADVPLPPWGPRSDIAIEATYVRPAEYRNLFNGPEVIDLTG